MIISLCRPCRRILEEVDFVLNISVRSSDVALCSCLNNSFCWLLYSYPNSAGSVWCFQVWWWLLSPELDRHTWLVFPACSSDCPLDPPVSGLCRKGLCICVRFDSSADTASYSASISELIKAAVCVSHFWIWFSHMQRSNLITQRSIGLAGSPRDSGMCWLNLPQHFISPPPPSAKAWIYCPCLFWRSSLTLPDCCCFACLLACLTG